MKHKLLLTLGIAALALVGCTADVEVIVPQTPAPEGAIAIALQPSVKVTSVATVGLPLESSTSNAFTSLITKKSSFQVLLFKCSIDGVWEIYVNVLKSVIFL